MSDMGAAHSRIPASARELITSSDRTSILCVCVFGLLGLFKGVSMGLGLRGVHCGSIGNCGFIEEVHGEYMGLTGSL